MVTNFDYLKNESKFSAFADIAISAERIILIDPEACILNCRRAMEFAVKWMYSVDVELEMPYQDNLQSLMNVGEYRQIVGSDIWKRMDYIRRCGNNVAHSNRKLGKDEAMLCLENLYIFLDYVAYCYAKEYEERDFNPTLITLRAKKAKESKEAADAIKEELVKEQEKTAQQGLDLQKLLKENASLKEELSARRQEQQQTYTPKPLDLSEYDTRKLYIDAMLTDAGWTEGKDWINEVPLSGMANKSGTGYADYVLYDDMHRPLAIIEAKRTCADVAVGRQQAKLYADIIEKECGRRPVIFLTNGFETHIIDGQYPERKCSFIYSKRDLEKWFNLLAMRTSLKNVTVDKNIAGRYYQEAAIKAVCSSLDEKNRRKALLVMATGSGKTRTVIALCKILLDAGWVKNILFLADRNSLVTQAKRSFVNLLPSLSCTNLVEEKDNYNAHCVFSTYQTMINCIDVVNDKEGKLFTCGHFDLVICDEAHRSIYNKYKDIFHYFDAPLIGLTATPKSEIDKNTYEVFELEDGVPTYGYDLAQAVKDEYLVDYISIESKLKFIDQGIVYDELSEEEKEEYERTFVDEEGKIPEVISSSELNTWIFNEDTIRQALNILMTEGIKIEYGQKLGKARGDLRKKVKGVAGVANIPEIQAQTDLIQQILTTDYVEEAGVDEFEEIREKLRNLMKYIPGQKRRYDTNFEDDVLSIEWKEAELENDELKNYKAKAEFYIRQHQDNIAIAKLKTNQPLTSTDIESLEEILWKEVGTRSDYEQEIGEKPLGEFVREIVGLDMNAAKEAFSEYLTDTNLDSRQIYFVNQIVEYIVHNGMLKDFSVLQEAPFTDQGSVVEIFKDITVWMGIKRVIDSINANAAA